MQVSLGTAQQIQNDTEDALVFLVISPAQACAPRTG